MPLPSPETSPANAGGFEQPTRRGSPVGDPSAAASGPIASRTGLFSDDFSEDTFWRNDTRRDAAHEPTPPPSPGELPARADVVIVGSGYTGLHAAIQTARAGRDTVVLEAGEPGGGCSTRNGGQISTSIKPSLEALTRRFGAERARAIRGEGVAALDWTEDFVRSEAIDCDFRRAGRFHGAHTPASYERLAREAELGMRREGIEAFAVPRAEQRGQLGSDLYHGGVVYPRFATLHPGRYHRGLLDAARAAGVRIVAGCRAERIDDARRGGPGGGTGDVTVHSSLGAIRCRDLAIATNGYTGELLPWLQRRVIPIGSYVIATEELPAGTVDALFPSARIATDTRRVVYYYGPTPDRRRVVFGGRVSTGETDPKISGPRLHAEMVRIFPELAGSRIAHSWSGFVAYTFDELAHCGLRDGIHYSMGYCGSGVSMSSYLGMRMGQRMLGLAEGRTAFDELPFPTRPLYAGKPWFLPAVVAWYRWRDRLEMHRAARRITTSEAPNAAP